MDNDNLKHDSINLSDEFLSHRLDPIDYIRNNTDYYTRFKDYDLIEVCADKDNNLYLLFHNANKDDDFVYVEKDDSVILGATGLVAFNSTDIVVSTSDGRIIWFNNKEVQDYFGDVRCDKFDIFIDGIIALKGNKAKIVSIITKGKDLCYEYEEFSDVDDIKADVKNCRQVVYIKQQDKWIDISMLMGIEDY